MNIRWMVTIRHIRLGNMCSLRSKRMTQVSKFNEYLKIQYSITR